MLSPLHIPPTSACLVHVDLNDINYIGAPGPDPVVAPDAGDVRYIGLRSGQGFYILDTPHNRTILKPFLSEEDCWIREARQVQRAVTVLAALNKELKSLSEEGHA